VFWKQRDQADHGAKVLGMPAKIAEQEWTSGELTDQRLVAPVPVLRPSLGPDTHVSGRLSFTVPTRIDGKLRGEVRASELLVVGEDAVVEGIVRALKLIVLGEVRGEVRGAERVEIGPSGRVMGTVETQSLVVNEGGCLDGDCRIAPPRANLRVLRPAPAV
jgi:cytoskeletal protein CcmA (bactofilin family)